MAEPGSRVGQRLVAGRYRLTGVIGRGGAGVVWQATDELIGRSVAVKELRLPPALAAAQRAQLSERALREARTAGQIRHPAVVAVHDIVPATAEDEAIYIVMEFVAAPTLADTLAQEGALPDARVAAVGAGVLGALAAAHAIGVVHRDVKPGNIMVLPGDKVKLVDFGIAHVLDDTRLTRDGVLGSTGYLAPELFHGEQPAPAADLWAVGAVLFHAVTGRGPFLRQSTAATLHAVLYEDLPPVTCAPPLASAIAGLLARDPGERLTGEQAAALLRSVAADAEAAPLPSFRPAGMVWDAHPTTTTPVLAKREDEPQAAISYVPPRTRHGVRWFVGVVAVVLVGVLGFVATLLTVGNGRFSSTPAPCMLDAAAVSRLVGGEVKATERDGNSAYLSRNCSISGRLVIGEVNTEYQLSITVIRYERKRFTSADETAGASVTKLRGQTRNINVVAAGDEAFVGQLAQSPGTSDTASFAVLRSSNLVIRLVEAKYDDMHAEPAFRPETIDRLREFVKRCSAELN